MQSDLELTARRDPAEVENDVRPADGLALFPVSIIALGCPTQPVERLMALQSAAARVAAWLTMLFRARPRLRLRAHARSTFASR